LIEMAPAEPDDLAGHQLDASLIAAPRQRNTDGEKKAIKEGRMFHGPLRRRV
jgi:hypothetical protein